MSISFLLVTIEDKMTTAITFSALIAIMFIGIGLQKKRRLLQKRISVKYGKLWVGAEVFLFCTGGGNGQYRVSGKGWNQGGALIAGALVFGCWVYLYVCLESVFEERKSLCDDGVYTESNRAGSNRRNSAFAGFACGIWYLRWQYLQLC